MNTSTQESERNSKIREYSLSLLNFIRKRPENNRQSAFLLCWRFLAFKSQIEANARATLDEGELNQLIKAAGELLANRKAVKS